MHDEVFSRLVAEEVKNRVSRQQHDYLRLPENWVRWQRCLITLVENLDSQLRDIQDEEQETERKYQRLGEEGLRLAAESLAVFESRRKKIQRFRFHVEARLDEVTRMIALGSDAIDDRMKTVEFLRKSIEEHRSMVIDNGFEATPIDHALWSALEGKWEFDTINIEDLV